MENNDLILNRLGTDLEIEWPVMIDDGSIPLSEYDIKVYLKCKNFKKEASISIENNTIGFTFYGKDQRVAGMYDMELILNEGKTGQVIADYKNAFRLYV